MKKTAALLCIGLSAVMLFSTGCAKKETGEAGAHRLYLKTDYAYDEVKAVFINKANGNEMETVMKRDEDGKDFCQYSCMGDTQSYNKVYFKYREDQTDEVAFNDLVDGWYISSYGLFPCTEGVEFTQEVSVTHFTLPFQGNDKDIYVWIPADYDPDSKEKYSVIYLLDGDSILADKEKLGTWGAPESITSAMKYSDFKAIAVGIANPEETREQELIPDIGIPADVDDEDYEIRDGNKFSDFVINSVVPEIEKKYNVYTDPEHNAIAGSSLGGLESFYIGLEHPQKFGTIGALSPSFWMYDESTWKFYFKKKNFGKNAPFIYLYAGDDINDNGICTKPMSKLLDKLDYPEGRKVLDLYAKGDHLVKYWRYIFPEFLEAMHTKKVAALM